MFIAYYSYLWLRLRYFRFNAQKGIEIYIEDIATIINHIKKYQPEHMKKSSLFIIMIWAVCLLSSCTTSKSVVSSNVNLNKYEYAAIINNDTYHIPAELMQYEIQLYDAVEGSGLKLISDWRINGLSPQQQERLLIVKYGVTVTDEETIITVNFIDYLSGRPIASCRGASSSLGISHEADMRGALKNVAKQIAETFKTH